MPGGEVVARSVAVQTTGQPVARPVEVNAELIYVRHETVRVQGAGKAISFRSENIEEPVGKGTGQGLAIAWSRILDAWVHDEDPGLAKTMAALDRALMRGSRFVARAEDLHRLTAPLRSMVHAACDRRQSFRERVRERWSRRRDAQGDAAPEVL